jgi:drug/metabolite transporter (DMT)-like permease
MRASWGWQDYAETGFHPGIMLSIPAVLYLLAASLLWAFSFGLTKSELTGLPPAQIAFLRLSIGALIFFPWVKRLPNALSRKLLAIGALQFGLMYLALNASYAYLRAHEVALFTSLTPLYVVALARRTEGGRSLHALALAAASLVAAFLVIGVGQAEQAYLGGVVLLQCANIAFALGQIAYRNTMQGQPHVKDHQALSLLLLGGVLLCIPSLLLPLLLQTGEVWVSPSPRQWLVLTYLGLVASGVAFWLWNIGTRLTSVAVLAVMNNGKVPLAVMISLLVFEPTLSGSSFLKPAAASLLLALAVALGSRPSRSATVTSSS